MIERSETIVLLTPHVVAPERAAPAPGTVRKGRLKMQTTARRNPKPPRKLPATAAEPIRLTGEAALDETELRSAPVPAQPAETGIDLIPVLDLSREMEPLIIPGPGGRGG